jgi:S-DNA-T family DNA segregation ATPase FtsK/SpoIIIE
MNRRYAVMYDERGADDFWEAGGPTVDMPYLSAIFDECQTWMDDPDIVADVEDLAKKIRGAGIGLWLATQKPTHNSLPTQIRDVATASICFPVLTDTAAVAALGPEIRDYPEMNPARIMKPAYRGVGTIRTDDGFIRFKSPFTTAKLSTDVVARSAQFVRDIPGVTVGLEHRKVDVPDSIEGLTMRKKPGQDGEKRR